MSERCGWCGEHTPDYPSQWVAFSSCSVEALRRWVRQAERDDGQRPGLTTDERQRLKALEREVIELKRPNEILRKASAFFGQGQKGMPFAAASRCSRPVRSSPGIGRDAKGSV